jgi:hypothetical protein
VQTQQLSLPVAELTVGALLSFLTLQLVLPVRHESQAFDEAYHIRAGRSYWPRAPITAL